ncbi:MAG: hypothetical protein LHV69_11370 [Elusimicrobia bacterium]|nr:hypothetical protein [Candidatus Obscuribacterium magneticum]
MDRVRVQFAGPAVDLGVIIFGLILDWSSVFAFNFNSPLFASFLFFLGTVILITASLVFIFNVLFGTDFKNILQNLLAFLSPRASTEKKPPLIMGFGLILIIIGFPVTLAFSVLFAHGGTSLNPIIIFSFIAPLILYHALHEGWISYPKGQSGEINLRATLGFRKTDQNNRERHADQLRNLILAISRGDKAYVIDLLSNGPRSVDEVLGRNRIPPLVSQRGGKVGYKLNFLVNMTPPNLPFVGQGEEFLSHLPPDLNWSPEKTDLLLAVLLALGVDQTKAKNISNKLNLNAHPVLVLNEEFHHKFKNDEDRRVYMMAALLRAGALAGKPITILVAEGAKSKNLLAFYRNVGTQMKGFGARVNIQIESYPQHLNRGSTLDPELLKKATGVELDNTQLICPEGIELPQVDLRWADREKIEFLRKNMIVLETFLPFENLSLKFLTIHLRKILQAA